MTADEEAIGNVLAAFVDAWNRHDAEAFASVFAEDADCTNVRGKSAHGRAEIEKFHTPLFATVFKDSQQVITDTRIIFIRSDVAAVDAFWEMTGATDHNGSPRPPRKGLLNFIMTKEGDTWSIAVMNNTELPA
jgi:uncharacterized protein (TIGR02246 family)